MDHGGYKRVKAETIFTQAKVPSESPHIHYSDSDVEHDVDAKT